MLLVDILYLFSYFVILYTSILWFTIYFLNRKKIFQNPKLNRFPPITFLVPAYNAANHIERCVKKILELNYPKEKIEIIIIDDGSTDNTLEVAKRISKKEKNVRVLEQEHKGKAAALNLGLKHVRTELFACMDVDSFPDKEFLTNSLGYLEKKGVVAVTPSIKVIETNSLIRKIQWVEYLFQIYLRKLFSIFDCQYVIPGPGGIYKTEIVKKVGGFDEKNLTEDMEIAFRLIDHGYSIENSINAYVWTSAPEKLKELYKQRIRWYRGYWKNVFKYSHMILNLKYGNLGFFLLPINFVWMFVLAFLLFAPIYEFISKLLLYLRDLNYINYAISTIEIEFPNIMMIDFYFFFGVLFLLFSLLVIWISVNASGEKIRLRKRLSFYISFLFIYPILITIFWMLSIIFELFRVKYEW